MKFVLSALFVWAFVPAILAKDDSSLWDLIGDKVEASPHIIDGDEAQPGAFPHQAYLDINLSPGRRTYCGGSLIDPQWVLTAAHCVASNTGIIVLLGLHDRFDLGAPTIQPISVDKIFIEEEYKIKHTDIALVKLKKPANLTQFVKTIRLPAKTFKGTNLAGTPAEVIGWGKFRQPYGGTSPVLRNAPTKVISNEECGRKGFANSIKEWRICSERSDGKGPCIGDNGGPIFMTENDGKRTLIGIISNVSKSCNASLPVVYTRVDYWLEWINKLTGIPLRD